MSNRWLIVIGGIVAVLIIAGVVVALSRSGKTTFFPEDTPEGVVQRYLQALEKEDHSLAYSYLSADAKERKPFQEFRRELSFRSEKMEQRQVVLEKSGVFDSTAEVFVSITEFRPSGPLTFQASEYSFSASFFLQKENGKWLITDSTWPVFFPRPIKPPPPPAPAQ